MSARKNAYEKTDDATANREERMTRLKYELRTHIRFLSAYEILSTDWLRMAESLHQIANVAFMETHLPPSEDNPLLQKGKKPAGTLWDQERDELAIRILLEEGKLNLALRLLHQFKEAQRAKGFTDQVKETCKKFNSNIATVTERCRIFEYSLGVLLKFALCHVEALQILDVPEFMTHVKEVLEDANASTKTSLGDNKEKMQNTMVIYYLSKMAQKMEDCDEDRVMDLLEQNNIVSLLVTHLQKHYTWYKSESRMETLQEACKFLSFSLDSEAYRTEPAKFTNEETTAGIVALGGLFIHELVESFGLPKKSVLTLLDYLVKWEKKAGGAPARTPLKAATTDEKKE